jgi:starch-binding outer membrane protein, SusD/RagB family
MKKTIKNISILLLLLTASCKKLIEIPPPVSMITSSQVFSGDAQALSAMSDVYFNMSTQFYSFSNCYMTVLGGLSADDLQLFDHTNAPFLQFQQDNLSFDNYNSATLVWAPAYNYIYGANAVIEGLQGFNGVSAALKTELTGEAEFVRAYCNFYLVNLFGDIPLVNSINYLKTGLLARTPAAQVYQAIIADLVDAQGKLAKDYTYGNGQRIVPNYWAATALLARVYLYLGRYSDAYAQSNTILTGGIGLYGLAPLNGVFNVNSNEAIWQLQSVVSQSPYFNGTGDGYILIPTELNTNDFVPNYYLSSTLLDSFEPNDQRRNVWVDSTVYYSVKYYFPYKYILGYGQVAPGGTAPQYYTMLRLSEQYLIRAEAEAHSVGNGLSGAVADLNVVRNRAGLPNYAGDSASLTAVMNAIMHENQVEFFCEWGHRWFDLKRWGTATTVLSTEKGLTVSQNALLWPIPPGDLKTDPNLTQNKGYN